MWQRGLDAERAGCRGRGTGLPCLRALDSRMDRQAANWSGPARSRRGMRAGCLTSTESAGLARALSMAALSGGPWGAVESLTHYTPSSVSSAGAQGHQRLPLRCRRRRRPSLAPAAAAHVHHAAPAAAQPPALGHGGGRRRRQGHGHKRHRHGDDRGGWLEGRAALQQPRGGGLGGRRVLGHYADGLLQQHGACGRGRRAAQRSGGGDGS